MRKRTRVLLLAVVVAAFVVPVSFAVSIDDGNVHGPVAHLSVPAAAVASTATSVSTSVVIAGPVATHVAQPGHGIGRPQVPDAAKLLLVGTILFGVAAFVRRAV